MYYHGTTYCFLLCNYFVKHAENKTSNIELRTRSKLLLPGSHFATSGKRHHPLTGSSPQRTIATGPSMLSNSLQAFEDQRYQDFYSAYSDCAQYGKANFWDERYIREIEPFEWYYPYEVFRAILHCKVSFSSKVMIAGCGSSNMIEDMAADGYEELVGCDFSRVAVAQMEIRCNDIPQASFHLRSLTDSDYENECFDAIIDKAAFDSIMCSDNGSTKVRQYVHEMERILTETGTFIVISHNNPSKILPYLEQNDIEEPNYTPWQVEIKAIGKFIALNSSHMMLLTFLKQIISETSSVRRRRTKQQRSR